MKFLSSITGTTITANNVGIGISTPAHNLHICSSNAGTMSLIQNTHTSGKGLAIQVANDDCYSIAIADSTGAVHNIQMFGNGDICSTGIIKADTCLQTPAIYTTGTTRALEIKTNYAGANVAFCNMNASAYGMYIRICNDNNYAFAIQNAAGTSTSANHPIRMYGNGIICACNLALTGVQAKTTETSLAFFKSDGTIVSGTSTGGGISFNGSTANGLVTYGNATTADVEANLTFNGSCLTIAGGADRVIELSTAGGSTLTCDLFVRGACRNALGPAGQGNAGAVYLDGGNTTTLTAPTCGGYVYIRGGGANSSAGGACGGNVMICGGSGTMSSNPGIGCGGNVYICTGVGNGNGGTNVIGTIYLNHGTGLKLNTTTTGVCVSGILGASSSLVTPAVCATCFTNTTLALCAVASSCTVLFYNGSAKLCTVTNGICLGANCGFGVDFVATSDVRLKKDIQPISNALSMVIKLQGVCYHGCDDENCELRIGLIAQDVEKVIPEVVSHSAPSEDDVKYGITDAKLGLKYDKLTAVLIEAIKEQQEQINALKHEICSLKGN